MTALRVLLALAAIAVAVAFAVIGRPQVFAIAMPCALVLFLVGAGLVASDSIPLRPWALAASLAAVATAPVLALQPARIAGILAGMTVALLQVRALREARTTPTSGAVDPAA